MRIFVLLVSSLVLFEDVLFLPVSLNANAGSNQLQEYIVNVIQNIHKTKFRIKQIFQTKNKTDK